MPRYLPPPTAFINSSSALNISTYDGSNTLVEPDIIDFNLLPEKSFQGHRYWMVNCPYQNADNQYENPCIWYSDDGLTWIVPTGLTNPIIAYPGGGASGNNADPCLVYDSNLKKLRIYYIRENSSATKDILRMVESLDGVSWVNDQQLISFPNDGTYYQAPSIYYNPVNNNYKMWIMQSNALGSGFINFLQYTSTDGITWAGPTTCTMINPIPQGIQPFHGNIKKLGNYFYGVMTGYQNGHGGLQYLYYLYSTDSAGTKFIIEQKPLLTTGSNGNFDQTNLYRSVLLPNSNGWSLWYTGISSTTYKMGYTTQ